MAAVVAAALPMNQQRLLLHSHSVSMDRPMLVPVSNFDWQPPGSMQPPILSIIHVEQQSIGDAITIAYATDFVCPYLRVQLNNAPLRRHTLEIQWHDNPWHSAADQMTLNRCLCAGENEWKMNKRELVKVALFSLFLQNISDSKITLKSSILKSHFFHNIKIFVSIYLLHAKSSNDQRSVVKFRPFPIWMSPVFRMQTVPIAWVQTMMNWCDHGVSFQLHHVAFCGLNAGNCRGRRLLVMYWK